VEYSLKITGLSHFNENYVTCLSLSLNDMLPHPSRAVLNNHWFEVSTMRLSTFLVHIHNSTDSISGT
jgi:hypothetical protein